MENTKSPQFKHIESGDWAGSRKSSLAPFRLSCDSTVDVQSGTTKSSGSLQASFIPSGTERLPEYFIRLVNILIIRIGDLQMPAKEYL